MVDNGNLKEKSEVLYKILHVLYAWSGVTDETPYECEIISSDTDKVTFGELIDAGTALDTLVNAAAQKSGR